MNSLSFQIIEEKIRGKNKLEKGKYGSWCISLVFWDSILVANVWTELYCARILEDVIFKSRKFVRLWSYR